MSSYCTPPALLSINQGDRLRLKVKTRSTKDTKSTKKNGITRRRGGRGDRQNRKISVYLRSGFTLRSLRLCASKQFVVWPQQNNHFPAEALRRRENLKPEFWV